MDLKQRVALITGGASGLGAAAARMLAEEQALLVLVDLDDAKGEALASELGEQGHYLRGDVTSPEAMEAAVNEAVDRFGRLEIAINCAGIGGSQRVTGKRGPAPLDWFRQIVEVNLIGTFNTIRLAATAMLENQPGADGERGVIINTASIAAFDGQIGQAAYAASKGGIAGMTLPIARDLARHGIRNVTIAPGLFDTPLLARVPDDVRQALGESVPYPSRLGDAPEYALLVRQIIENRYLNGEVIRLDAALRMAPQ